MKFRKSMLSASIVTALMFAVSAQAQDTTSQNQTTSSNQNQKQNQKQKQTATGEQTNTNGQSNTQQLETIQVVGIRASLQKSLETKRNANASLMRSPPRTSANFQPPTWLKRWRRSLV